MYLWSVYPFTCHLSIIFLFIYHSSFIYLVYIISLSHLYHLSIVYLFIHHLSLSLCKIYPSKNIIYLKTSIIYTSITCLSFLYHGCIYLIFMCLSTLSKKKRNKPLYEFHNAIKNQSKIMVLGVWSLKICLLYL